MDPRFWDPYDGRARLHYRGRNAISHAIIRAVNDQGGAQLLQTEHYLTELRDDMVRVGMFGIGSVPLPGALAVVVHQGGHRGTGTVVGVEDARYRMTGYKGGEAWLGMVEGAGADGNGGIARKVVEAVGAWVVNHFGRTVNLTDSGTEDFNLGHGTMTITVTGHTVNITGAHGDVVVEGISLRHHKHAGVVAGTDVTSEPVAS